MRCTWRTFRMAFWNCSILESSLAVIARLGQGRKGEGERMNVSVPWSIILDVVFLDFLDVVVGLRFVHAFKAGCFCQ